MNINGTDEPLIMTKASDPNSMSKRDHLLKAKLGRFYDWQPPDIEPTIGPFDPSAFRLFDQSRQNLAAECAEKLNTYSDDLIDMLIDGNLEEIDDIRKDWRYFRSEEISRLKKHEPPWYAGGFGHPDYVADFENWCKMQRLKVDEALLLTTGIEPGHFSLNSLEELGAGPLHKLEDPLRFLMMRYEQLKRRFCTRRIDAIILPKDLLKWSEEVQFELHPECERLLEAYYGSTSKPAKTEQNESLALKKPDRREIDSIAKLFTIMAIDHLGYQPNEPRSPIPKEISDLAATKGISISEDTVRKYLQLGARFISDEWEPE